MIVCTSLLISVCMLIVSKALLVLSATAGIHLIELFNYDVVLMCVVPSQ